MLLRHHSLAIAGCGRNPCRNLATEVCERAPKTVACEAAGKLTADDECNDYLKNLDKFIELKNTTVTEEGVKPPAPEAPAAEAAPVETADGAAAPTATEGAQPRRPPPKKPLPKPHPPLPHLLKPVDNEFSD